MTATESLDEAGGHGGGAPVRMFTDVEGGWDEVMRVLKACIDRVAEVAPRVSVVVKVDHRAGVTDALTSKVRAVEARLTSS